MFIMSGFVISAEGPDRSRSGERLNAETIEK